MALNSFDRFGLVTIIVHGTWAQDEKWWTTTGDYVSELKKHSLGNIHEWSGWSGTNDHGARVQGAQSLLNEILPLCKNSIDDPINIVAHSHGGNVVWLMLERLAQECPCCTIGAVILLGVPNMVGHDADGTSKFIYASQPAANMARNIVNISSENDNVQTNWADVQDGVSRDDLRERGIDDPRWINPLTVRRDNPYAHQNYPSVNAKSRTETAASHSDLHSPKFANEHAYWINAQIPLLRGIAREMGLLK